MTVQFESRYKRKKDYESHVLSLDAFAGDWPDSASLPCYQVRIKVWIPPGTRIQEFDFRTTALDVFIAKGLDLTVRQGGGIVSVSGNITTPPLDAAGRLPYKVQSPQVHIATNKGSVNGWFPMYNVLALSSFYGDIAAQIGPKPLNPSDPSPSFLSIHNDWGMQIYHIQSQR